MRVALSACRADVRDVAPSPQPPVTGLTPKERPATSPLPTTLAEPFSNQAPRVGYGSHAQRSFTERSRELRRPSLLLSFNHAAALCCSQSRTATEALCAAAVCPLILPSTDSAVVIGLIRLDPVIMALPQPLTRSCSLSVLTGGGCAVSDEPLLLRHRPSSLFLFDEGIIIDNCYGLPSHRQSELLTSLSTAPCELLSGSPQPLPLSPSPLLASAAPVETQPSSSAVATTSSPCSRLQCPGSANIRCARPRLWCCALFVGALVASAVVGWWWQWSVAHPYRPPSVGQVSRCETAASSAADALSVMLVVASHEEDYRWIDHELSNPCFLPWLPTPLPRTVYTDLPRYNLPHVSTYVPTQSNEASMYLTYLVQHYNRLPDRMLFIHGHRDSWHVKDQAALIRHLRWNLTGYHSLFYYMNDQQDLRGSVYEPWFHEVYRGRLGHINQTAFLLHCCATFLVDRASVLRHPKALYVDALNWSVNPGTTPYHSGRFFEYTYPLMFSSPQEMAQWDTLSKCELYFCDEDFH